MNVKGLLEILLATQLQKVIAKGATRAGAGGGLAGGLASALGSRAGSAIAAMLASMVLGSKGGRALGGKLGRLGGLAAIGALAWQAYQEWQSKQAPRPAGGAGTPARRASFLETEGTPFGPPPAGSPLAPSGEAEEDELSRILVRAMIAAAKADGHIDETEAAAIGRELQALPLSEADRAFVAAELDLPPDVDRVARGVAGNPQLTTAVYAASLLAITVDAPEERDYLAALARRLELPPDLVATLHAKVDEAAPAA